MSGPRYAATLAVCLIAALACSDAKADLAEVLRSPTAVARATRLEAALTGDSAGGNGAPIAQWVLPHAIQEISGLALTSDGRLLVHDDEIAQIWEVDYRRGVVVKRFSLGKGSVTGDFEGITVANDMVYMITGHGRLFEFREGANNTHVEYKVHETGLAKDCEFEGIAFDSTNNALLLACKNVLNKQFAGSIVIYRWSLTGDSTSRLSQITVPIAAIVGTNGWKTLRPSDISIDPLTGNYVLVASQENAMFSITPAGALVFARSLPPRHQQAEGVAITKDNILIVSDEAGKLPAIITLYRWP